jgi:prepilin peptidase CpaA
MTHQLELALVLCVAAIAAYTDMKTGRIPNVLPASLLVAALILTGLAGWQSAAISAALFVLVFSLGTLLFSLKLIGGGDVKLLAAAAAALGWPDTAAFLLYTILAGGVLGLIIALARGRLRPMLANMRAMLFPVLSGVRPAPVPSAVGSMPYGLAIFAGAATLAAGYALGLNLRISL